MFAAKELGLDADMLSYRLRQLTLLLPDMSESRRTQCHRYPKRPQQSQVGFC